MNVFRVEPRYLRNHRFKLERSFVFCHRFAAC
jgi:hypothetical protein